MGKLDYNHLLIFHKLAEMGTISETARVMEISVAKVSRDIKLLEAALDTVLFMRKKMGLQLTSAGEALLAKTKGIVEVNHEVENFFLEQENAHQLDLNIVTVKGYSAYYVTIKLLDFLLKFPEVRLNLIASGAEELEYFSFGDVRLSHLPIGSGEDEQIELGTSVFKFIASPEYIQKMGMPKTFEDLKRHALICHDFGQGGGREWFLDELNIEPKYQVNHFFSILSFVKKGLGIAFMLEDYARQNLNQIVVLDHLPVKSMPQYLSYRKNSLRKTQVSQLIDFLKG